MSALTIYTLQLIISRLRYWRQFDFGANYPNYIFVCSGFFACKKACFVRGTHSPATPGGARTRCEQREVPCKQLIIVHRPIVMAVDGADADGSAEDAIGVDICFCWAGPHHSLLSRTAFSIVCGETPFDLLNTLMSAFNKYEVCVIVYTNNHAAPFRCYSSSSYRQLLLSGFPHSQSGFSIVLGAREKTRIRGGKNMSKSLWRPLITYA